MLIGASAGRLLQLLVPLPETAPAVFLVGSVLLDDGYDPSPDHGSDHRHTRARRSRARNQPLQALPRYQHHDPGDNDYDSSAAGADEPCLDGR